MVTMSLTLLLLLLLLIGPTMSSSSAGSGGSSGRTSSSGSGSGGDDAGTENNTDSSNADSNTSDTSLDEDSTVFRHFIAHNKTMTCSADEHAQPFNNQIRGVNLGGWMVLEPWITPSLFYQFLGGNETQTAFDMYTFCDVLDPKEANKQLVRHWDTWVTEDIIKQLHQSAAVNSLRLPIGDFLFVPYGPYANGCVDGALQRIDLLLDWAYSYGISVLLDIHTMKDSQNGFDNSGRQMGFAWTSACTYIFCWSFSLLRRDVCDYVCDSHPPLV